MKISFSVTITMTFISSLACSHNVSSYLSFTSMYIKTRNFRSVTFIEPNKNHLEVSSIVGDFSRSGVGVSISEFPTSFHGNLLHVLFFTDAYFAANVLRQASSENLLTSGKHWLIMTKEENVNLLYKILCKLKCFVDADLFVAVVTGDTILLQEVYNTGVGGQQIVSKLGYWRKQNNSTDILDLSTLKIYKYQRRGNLLGLKLRVGVVEVNRMYCITAKDDESTTRIVGGYSGSVFNEIQRRLNFTSEVHILPGYAYGVYTKENDSWSGLAGELQRREIDIVGCEMSATFERNLHMGFSQPVHVVGRRIYYKRPQKEFHADAFFRPFNAQIWCLLCVTLPVLAGLAYLLGFCSPFRTTNESMDSYANHFFGLLSALLLQGWPGIYSDSPRRALLGTAMLAYLVVSLSYSSKMVALRTAEKPTLPITTLEDVYANPDWDFGFISNALDRFYFQGADETTLLGKLWQRIESNAERSLVSDVTSGLQRALDKKFVFLAFHQSCQEILALKFSEEDACKLQVINDKDYFKGGIAFGLPKDSPYQELIDYRLQEMRETGVLDRLLKESLPKSAVCESPPFTMITLVDVAPALMLLACGAVTSMIILVLEMICVIRKRRHNKRNLEAFAKFYHQKLL